MASLTLTVTGMTCSHCQKTVETALKEVRGVRGAAVFLEDGEAEVEYDADRATPDALVAAVATAGYTASPKS